MRRRNIGWSWIFGVLLLLSASAEAEVLTRAKVDGDSAFASWCGGGFCGQISYHTVRNVPDSILVNASFSNAAAGTITRAHGYVPLEALQGSEQGHVVLAFDPASVPGFFFQTCTRSYPQQCTTGAGGPVRLEWHRTNDSVQHRVGTTRTTTGDITVTSTGQNDLYSASITGVAFGQAVPDGAEGEMGLSREMDITIERADANEVTP